MSQQLCFVPRTSNSMFLILSICLSNNSMSPEKDHPENPSYRQVCTGSTGHVEVLQVELNDPVHFEDLIKFFFLFHDPTTMNQQGNDTGTQYASAIFVADEQQKEICQKVLNDLQNYAKGKKSPYRGKEIVTQIHDATKFVSVGESATLLSLYFL